jgi:hypothetical protein
MNSLNRQLFSHDLSTSDEDEEISSIRSLSSLGLDRGLGHGLDLELGMEIDTLEQDRRGDDPAPVYARLYSIVAGQRCDFPGECFLGTRFEDGIIASATWEEEMRAVFATEGAISTCRRYLDDNAL